jgi:cation transport regulator ChaB
MADPDEIDEVIKKSRRKTGRPRLGRFRRSVETSDEAVAAASPDDEEPIAEGSPEEPATEEEEIPFDAAAAHRVFSVEAFNSAWDLIEKTDRSDDDIDEMIDLAHASAWHWAQRGDVGPKNRAISAWQLSRVYAEAGRYEEAERWANRSLDLTESSDVGPVFTGYAYEALARLANETGDTEKRDEWLAMGRAQAELVDDKLDRARLLGDLDDLS